MLMSKRASRTSYIRSQRLGRGKELSDQDFERFLLNEEPMSKRQRERIGALLGEAPWLAEALQFRRETPIDPVRDLDSVSEERWQKALRRAEARRLA